MDEELLSRLDDILEQCENISLCVSKTTRDEFVTDPIYSAAMIRYFEVIGEAARNAALHPCASDFPEIPWKKLIGLRNVLIHEYPVVNLNILWGFAVNQIPKLQADIRRMRDTLAEQ